MPTYTVILNDEQNLALEYETERKAAMPLPVSPGSSAPPPLTPGEVLQMIVSQHFDMLGMQAQSVVAPLREMVLKVEPGAREALISALTQPSLQNYLRVLERRG